MKKYFILFTLIVSFTTAAIFFVIISKNKNSAKTEIKLSTNPSNKEEFCCVENLQAAGYSDNSIYQLKSIWRDENNTEVSLNKFYGKKVILSMIYTNCTIACPVIVNEMQRLEALIPGNAVNNYNFVVVSIDPKRDTPSRMKKFAEDRNLNLKRWTLLTGSVYNIAELAQAIGFRYKENQSGLFKHSNLITFINTKGEITDKIEGLNPKNEEFLTLLNK
jgi:protein SCO1/2